MSDFNPYEAPQSINEDRSFPATPDQLFRFGIILMAIAIAALRIFGYTSQLYQALAHLFVGGLVTAAFIEHKYTWMNGGGRSVRYLLLAVTLTIVEVACFVYFRFFT